MDENDLVRIGHAVDIHIYIYQSGLFDVKRRFDLGELHLLFKMEDPTRNQFTPFGWIVKMALAYASLGGTFSVGIICFLRGRNVLRKGLVGDRRFRTIYRGRLLK